MEDNLSLYDTKAIEEFKNLKNNRCYINDPQNNRKEEKDITYYSQVRCVDMIPNNKYIIDPKYFHIDLDHGFISARHIYEMVFVNISGRFCNCLSNYNNIICFKKNKYYFYQTIEEEKKAIIKRYHERLLMKLIINRRCNLGSIEIIKLVNEFL